MSSAVIPPPMADHTLQTEYPINHVAFHPTGKNIMLLLSNGSLAIVKKTSISHETNETGCSAEILIVRYYRCCVFYIFIICIAVTVL